MSLLRSSIQYDRLLKNISTAGTDHQRRRRKILLDAIDAEGSITSAQASELLGHTQRNGAGLLLAELVEEGLLTRVNRGTYIRDTQEGS